MNEADWLGGRDPEPMLALIVEAASERKRRLFVAGCCRRLWLRLGTDLRDLVEAGERAADEPGEAPPVLPLRRPVEPARSPCAAVVGPMTPEVVVAAARQAAQAAHRLLPQSESAARWDPHFPLCAEAVQEIAAELEESVAEAERAAAEVAEAACSCFTATGWKCGQAREPLDQWLSEAELARAAAEKAGKFAREQTARANRRAVTPGQANDAFLARQANERARPAVERVTRYGRPGSSLGSFGESILAEARTRTAQRILPGLLARAIQDELHAQADLLRELFGNPFRPTPPVAPAWLSWDAGRVPAMALQIYADRKFADLPVLADALEDAGCTQDTLLEHLRSAGPHCRGCWGLDALLGKT